METFLGREGGTEREERGGESKALYVRLVHTCSHHQNSGTGVYWTVQIYVKWKDFSNTVDWEIFVVKSISLVAYNDKIRRTKIFQCRSEDSSAGVHETCPPWSSRPWWIVMLFFSWQNSKRVRLAPCVAYTYLRLSRKLIFGAFNFRRCAEGQKYNSTKILTDENFLIYGKWILLFWDWCKWS